jgi:hypothetical protein
MDAIVYTSNTGTTKEYAELLGHHTGLPVHSLKDAKGTISDGSEIIYLGWIMASKVQGYDKALKHYKVKAVCGVCMGATGSQVKEIREKNHISEKTAVFSMQGGFDINKLHGIYKMMMTVMVKTAGKGLAEKTDRTPDEDVMLDMMLHGANHVSEDNLKKVLSWYNSEIHEA